MEEELLSLIFDYSINRKIADNAFCDKLLEIVLNHRGLHDFVKDAYYIRGEERTKTDKTAAYYMSVDRKIVVDFDNIESRLNYLKLVDPKFNELEVYLIRNIIIARTLLHELEHANQIKKVDVVNYLGFNDDKKMKQRILKNLKYLIENNKEILLERSTLRNRI